jgi:hypothetical protein
MAALRIVMRRPPGARAFSASAAPSAPSTSLAYGLKHLRGESKALANRSPIPGILGTCVFFSAASLVGWGIAQPQDSAARLSEVATAATDYVKVLVLGAAPDSDEE